VISCYPGKLSQVFMNIINNAIQAIPEDIKNGTINIVTKNKGGGIEVLISDNGIGMNQKVIDNLYKPLFTTKNKDEGTGLGMSITKEIIELHDGKIEVESVEGEGTKFTISL
ncbi:MAG: HAMP domain-containing sensor histidine kinase, partial [Cyclobacteriaceae bacterium]